MSRWQCSYIDAHGKRCESGATLRLHFSDLHPFDHVDVCPEHWQEFKSWTWLQNLLD